MDTFHMGTGILFSEGGGKEESYNVLGNYEASAEQTDERWGWRTQIEIINENKIIITAFNIDPQGEETKATEISYTRKGNKVLLRLSGREGYCELYGSPEN